MPAKVEFEWLRQYWFQGQRYTRFCSWWSGPMERLETDWRHMELMVSLDTPLRALIQTQLSATTHTHSVHTVYAQTYSTCMHASTVQTTPNHPHTHTDTSYAQIQYCTHTQ